MSRFIPFCFCALLFAASQAAGRSEYHLGGEDGNPWQDALAEDAAGSYLVFDDDGQQVRTVPVGATPHGAGTDTLIDFSGTSIKPRYIDPEVNMVLTDPESAEIKIPLPYTGGRAQTTDGCSAMDDHIRAVKKQFDGDITTAHFRRFTSGTGVFSFGGQVIAGVTGEGWKQAVVIDFGAAVPVNRIRFYPRLGQLDDALLIEELTAPVPPLESFGEDSFAENFVEWYEIRVGDNSVAFARSPCDKVSIWQGKRWVRTSDPQLEVLKSVPENLDVVVDLQFPTRSIRWITMRTFPLRNWEVAEFEVYGQGFVEETAFITQILDFGKPVNWGKIRWSGEVPEGTRVEIRTRTGKTPDPKLYFDESVNGDLEQITLKDYEKIDPTGRLPTVYDVENWSFWSPPYDFAAGLRDESHPPEAWKDGTPVLSPGPSRYIQIALRLFGTFTTPPRLDQLTLQFSEEPSAQKIVGEIWPIKVDSFTDTTFTYVVRPTFEADDTGFDRLEILTHTRVDNIHSVVLDGRGIDLDLFPVEQLDNRIVVSFPKLVGEEDSFKQLEVVFDAPVLRFGTEFSGWVFDSADPDRIKQQIRPGNATFRFSGDVLAVQTPVGGDLLVDVEVSPNPFTPNGDGINETLAISYKLREVTVTRPVSLFIYDLAGLLVTELPPIPSRSGAFRHQWDGRDASGKLVPPGTYLYKLTLKTEAEEDKIGVFSVAY